MPGHRRQPKPVRYDGYFKYWDGDWYEKNIVNCTMQEILYRHSYLINTKEVKCLRMIVDVQSEG